MSRKKRYIQTLSISEKADLEKGMKSKSGHQFRQRCHAVLLSHRGKEVSELESFFDVSKQTIYSWLNRWESKGIEGLKNQPGQGRKAALCVDNKDHVKAVDKAVRKVNQKGGNLLSEVDQELNLEGGLSMRMLRSFLKKLVTSGKDAEES